MVAENPAKVRLRLVGEPLADWLPTTIHRILNVPDLGHSTASTTHDTHGQLSLLPSVGNK